MEGDGDDEDEEEKECRQEEGYKAH